MAAYTEERNGVLSFGGSVANDRVNINLWGTNLIKIGEPATVINKNCYIQGLKWIDDPSGNNPLIGGNELRMTVNGVNVNLLCVIPLSEVWTLHFTKPLQVGSLVVSQIDGGALLVWLA